MSNLYDYCKNNYNFIINAYLGEENDLRNYSLGSQVNLSFICDRCKKPFERTVKNLVRGLKKNPSINKIYCSSCSKEVLNSSSIRQHMSLYDWEVEHSDSNIIIVEPSEDEDKKLLLTNSHKKIGIKCKLHSSESDEPVYLTVVELCGDRSKRGYMLPCCREAVVKFEFSIQDWCLLFWRVKLHGLVKDRYKYLKDRCFSGELVYLYLLDGYDPLTKSNSTSLEELQKTAFNSKLEKTFKCETDKKEKKSFNKKIFYVTEELWWCDTDSATCKKCNSYANKKYGEVVYSSSKSLDTFLQTYGWTLEGDRGLVELENKIRIAELDKMSKFDKAEAIDTIKTLQKAKAENIKINQEEMDNLELKLKSVYYLRDRSKSIKTMHEKLLEIIEGKKRGKVKE